MNEPRWGGFVALRKEDLEEACLSVVRTASAFGDEVSASELVSALILRSTGDDEDSLMDVADWFAEKAFRSR